MDRPMGSTHPRCSFLYPVNYGALPGTNAPDDGEIDAYVLGIFEPADECTGTCIAVIHRLDDDDDTRIVVPKNTAYSGIFHIVVYTFWENANCLHFFRSLVMPCFYWYLHGL